jgi:hypothetical protein
VLSERLRARGYTRVAEPCAGGFATSMVHRAAGWPGGTLEASDVGLYSAIIGYACSDQDLFDLDVRVDGEPVPLAGDGFMDAAILLHKQLELRLRKRPDSDYWRGMLRDVIERRDGHLKSLRAQVERQATILKGLSYRSEDIWLHVGRLVEDREAFATCNPP